MMWAPNRPHLRSAYTATFRMCRRATTHAPKHSIQSLHLRCNTHRNPNAQECAPWPAALPGEVETCTRDTVATP